jgi:NADH:ubiquinone oxidoreductase subunit E
VYGVASFYAQFRYTKPGEHMIKVCLGTACHVCGAVGIVESVERDLEIKEGETTKDDKFTLETVRCFGSCALAPVVVVDDEVYGSMTGPKALDILKTYR